MCNATSNLTNLTECLTNPTGATVFSPVFMCLTGVLGNLLALFSLYKPRTDVRTTKFYSLITGLVWTDILGILMSSPSVIIAYVNGRQWVGGEAHCRFHGFTMAVFGLATPLIICAMAVERFLALKCVFFYSSRCRTGTARGCILTLWFGVILYGLLPLFGFGRYEKQYPGTWCYVDFHSGNMATKLYGYIYACTNLVLILVIVLCNAYVVITIFKTRFKRDSKSSYALNHPTPENDGLVSARSQRRKSSDAEIQMIVLLCALTVVFTVCWAPLMIRIIITQATGVENVLLDLAAVRLASLNQTLDPWLYILLRRSTCMKIGKSVRHIKTKCIKVFGQKDMDSDNVDDNADNSIDHNAGNSLDRDRVNINPIQNEVLRNDNCNQRNIPQPDVMQNVTGGNKSPLPDITNTAQNKEKKDPCYVCHFQFGKSMAANEDDGMYVKILYLKNNSSSNIYNGKHQEQPVIGLRRQCTDNLKFIGSYPQSVPSGVHANCGNWQTKDSEMGTKETSLSHDNNPAFQSMISQHPFGPTSAHQSLRKTKSSNK